MQRRLFIAAFVVAGLSACAPLPPSGSTKTVDVTINHQTVAIPFKPQRVVVFEPASIDTLDAIGVRAVGIADLSLPAHLSYYKDVTKAGTLFEPDMAALTALKPDLIIVGGRSSKKAEELSKVATTIDLTTNNADFENSVFGHWETLGKIFGREDKVRELIASTKTEIKRVHAVASSKGTALQVMTIQDRIVSYAPQSRFGFIYDVLGFQPAFTAPAVAPVAPVDGATPARPAGPTSEALAASNPDWIFTFDRAAINADGKKSPGFKTREAFANTNALRHNHVVVTDEVNWYIYGNAGYGTLRNTLKEVAAALNVQ